MARVDRTESTDEGATSYNRSRIIWNKAEAWLTRDISTDKSRRIPQWLVIIYIIGTLILALISVFSDLSPSGPPPIPPSVYLYAGLGTSAYMFTNLIRKDLTNLTPRQSFYRLFAVLPVAAGIYLFSDILFIASFTDPKPLAGIMFLVGLFVEIFVQGLGTLTDRLLGGSLSSNEGSLSSDES